MSELINNSENRKAELKEIIHGLNSASDRTKAKKEMRKKFSALLKNLSPEEIAEAEQSLIEEGMAVAEVQKLCEVHVDAFESTLKRNYGSDRNAARLSRIPGHPVATFRAENDALRRELKKFLKASKNTKTPDKAGALLAAFESIALVELHFARKENQLFPFLEQAGFSGPSKVMWGKHNEIRELLKSFRSMLKNEDYINCGKAGRELARSLKRMMFMEEKILFPTALRKLSEAVWISIRRGEGAIGYAWIKPGNLWDSNLVEARSGKASNTLPAEASAAHDGKIGLSTGNLTAEQLNLMLTTLPIDISFIDEHDLVMFYSDNPDRVFPRSPAIIGREVQNCHPPASVHAVQQIIDGFKARTKTEAEFWIQMKGKFIYIQYFPLFSNGAFKGILEVTQDCTHIRALEGEKRL